MALLQSLPNLRKNFAARYSPWMLIGVTLILALAITVLAVRNAQRERAYMSQNLMNRADALIWAVEAGTRASMGMGMRNGAQNVQAIVEETARQAGVVYIVVTDGKGNRIASSSKEDVGKLFYEPQVLSGLGINDKSQWRSIPLPDEREVFEVYRTFSPLPNFQQHMLHTETPWDGCQDCPWGNRQSHQRLVATQGDDALLIFIGLDMKPFEAALAEDFRNTTITGIVVGLLALGGFMSLFWAQHYRLSRRILQDTNAFASEVVTSMPSGLITADKNGRISLVNSVASRLFGMPSERLKGLSLHALAGIPWEAITSMIEKGLPVHELEYAFTAPNGESIPISVSASCIINEENVHLGYLYLIEDIRERKRVQEQLRRSERLAVLGHMAARVAHEIRNPLSSLKGFARFFAEKMHEEGGKEIAFTMMEETDRLNRVVTELLDFARPSALTLEPGDIREVIKRAMRLTEDDAGKKGIMPTFIASADLPVINMDFERLTQVFLNLFINAVQAMDQGGKLSVSAAVHDSHIVVTVTDTGRGMSPDVLESIFTPYFTTKPAGTGLGLAIVLKILEEHGCKIKVDSVPGQGTTFMLLFPQNSPVKDNQ
ncbi:ATP-binding protein [uncultured Desulfovibrio sp.]|uniref:ATP-binding protein n=1 Tax=uncultured Desulfovibrio sp. TaxID=167968 RepID=UPI00260E8EB0|nr:ATP-binding protein [uncultured Desulfovibrio sp.]